MINVSNIYIEEMPWENFFTQNLQTPISFTLGSKTLRKGRLIIFKRSHFFIQVSLMTTKKAQEIFEIPIPFKTEYYHQENLIYFDYRINSLFGNDMPENTIEALERQMIKNTPSQYLNKILEIQAIEQ
jgi:hypothetical protein